MMNLFQNEKQPSEALIQSIRGADPLLRESQTDIPHPLICSTGVSGAGRSYIRPSA